MATDSQTFVYPTDEALEDAFTDVYDDGTECMDCPNKFLDTEPHGEVIRYCSLTDSFLAQSRFSRGICFADCPGVRKKLELD